MNRLATFSMIPSRSRAERAIRLSVIVPFAHQETEGTILLDQLQVLPRNAEIVLVRVAGVSMPRALHDAPSGMAARICASPPGRARQMNVGARAAHGHWLWFLHADSRLRAGTLAALQAFVASNRPALGYFGLRYRGDGPALAHLNAWGANLRARWLGMPFGDQGFVLPAAWFERLGGYDENAAYGEDHLLVWRARLAGLPLVRIAASLETSARKYAENGWTRTTLRHAWLTARQAWPAWRALRARRNTLRDTIVVKDARPS